MRVTLKDIAQKAGVSSACVSNILNGKTEEFTDITIKKVLKIADELNYRPNAVAKSMVTKATMTIGLILPDIANTFYSEVAKGVEEEASKEGYTTIYLNTNEDAGKEKEAFITLEAKMVDGVIFIPSVNSLQNEDILETLSYPIIAVDRNYFTKGIVGTVVVDDCEGAALAAKYLVQLGRKKIIYLSGNRSMHYSSDEVYDYFYGKNKINGELTRNHFGREIGFFEEMKKQNQKFERAYFQIGKYDPEFGYNSVQSALDNKLEFDAIFADSDMIAIGAMQAMNERGVRIPEDVAIIGYDNIFISKYANPALTTVNQPKYEMGVKATRMLLQHMKGSRNDELVMMKPDLVIRKTT